MAICKKKKPAPKAEIKKEVKPEVKEVKPTTSKAPSEAEGKKEVNFRNYHVVKREDGKWEVKYAGGKKAIKLFDTQKEAVEFTKKMAENQDGAMLVHNSKGQHKGRIKEKK